MLKIITVFIRLVRINFSCLNTSKNLFFSYKIPSFQRSRKILIELSGHKGKEYFSNLQTFAEKLSKYF